MKSLRKTGGSAFLRALATLMGGNAVATALPILAAPILGRIYAPADYGAMAQYMAPAAVLAVVASLQFQHAIIAERNDRSAGQVAWLTILGALAVAMVTALGIAVLWTPVLVESAVGAWLWVLPLTVAASGVFAAGSVLANRYRRYGWMARLQMGQVLATVALSMALGFLGWGTDGLLTAYLLGQLIQLSAYLWLLRDLRAIILPWPGALRLRVLVRRHWKFPTFTLPSGFASQLSMQAPVFALSALGAEDTLGAFTRARQLVAIPFTVAGQSTAEVFRREASEVYHETGSCRGLMLRTAGWLFGVGLAPCLLFMAFAPWLFEVYLGPNWREAGEIARILAPMLLLQLIVSPIATIYYIAGHQIEDLVMTLISAGLMALSMALVVCWAVEAGAVVVTYTVIFSIVYIVFLVRSLVLGDKSAQ